MSLVERAPQTRCYHCGSPEIAAVCHHCATAICDEHNQPKRRRGRSTAEFTDLDLDKTPCGDKPVHCQAHQHIVRDKVAWRTVLGWLLAGSGLYLIRSGERGWGGLVLVIGLALAVANGIVNRLRADTARRVRPPLPLLPRLDPVHARETLDARITLDAAGRYEAEVTSVTGCLTITATFGRRDRERVQKYRTKYRLGRDQGIPFALGFARLCGPATVALGLGPHDATVLTLDGYVSPESFLAGTGERISQRWEKELRYEVDRSSATTVPISLTPSLVQAAGRRALDLDLQWTELGATVDGQGPAVDRVDRLELCVPVTWGGVREVEGNAIVFEPQSDGDHEPYRMISWRRERITPAERRARRKTFAVRFERPIEAGSVRGRVEVRFNGALSRLEDVGLYYPLGHQRDDQAATTIETHVVADFGLNLAHVSYQDIRFVPDGKRPDDADKADTLIFEGVVPDHSAIIALTNAISEQGYYVKRVLENPPRTGSRANLTNRYWDIAGRRYLGVYPVDFHLVVTGEEVYNGNIRADAGTTKTTLTVQGAVANPAMEARVEGIWEQLNDLIAETLRQQERAT